jgi:hypothetical protein
MEDLVSSSVPSLERLRADVEGPRPGFRFTDSSDTLTGGGSVTTVCLVMVLFEAADAGALATVLAG